MRTRAPRRDVQGCACAAPSSQAALALCCVVVRRRQTSFTPLAHCVAGRGTPPQAFRLCCHRAPCDVAHCAHGSLRWHAVARRAVALRHRVPRCSGCAPNSQIPVCDCSWRRFDSRPAAAAKLLFASVARGVAGRWRALGSPKCSACGATARRATLRVMRVVCSGVAACDNAARSCAVLRCPEMSTFHAQFCNPNI